MLKELLFHLGDTLDGDMGRILLLHLESEMHG